MLRENEFFTCMGEKRTLSLLEELSKHDEPIILKDLQHITNHTQTLRARIDEMEEDGLVDVEVVYHPHKTVRVWLTPLGRDVCTIISMVSGDVAPGKPMKEKSIDLKYADPVLRQLNGNAYLVQKDILAVIPIYRNVVKVLAALEEDGLVTSEQNREGAKSIRYSLTPLGKHVADSLQLIYDKIKS